MLELRHDDVPGSGVEFPAVPAADAAALGAQLGPLLAPFLAQGCSIGSVVAIGADLTHGGGPLLFEVAADGRSVRAPVRIAGGGEETCLARLARAAAACAGADLLLASAAALEAALPPPGAELGFRAIAVVARERAADRWRLQRALFDRGLVGIGAARLGDRAVRCFLASAAVRRADRLDADPRGLITMAELGRYGAFANQLFQYVFLRLYGLRHGVAVAVPDWQGRELYGLRDAFSAGVALPCVRFPAFATDDLGLWECDEPPIDVDFSGYFQEISPRWRPHRPLLRSLFSLPAGQRAALEAWRQRVTEGGRRPLVALHVRRGDYRRTCDADAPWFRMVPEAWYLDWLRELWPTLDHPLLFVATDEPEAVLPHFAEFRPVSADGGPLASFPAHLRDFEILRRADHLALCNSSFSRMAALLAADDQKCFLPSFEERRFAPYEPWDDHHFWARFSGGMQLAHDVADRWNPLIPPAARVTWFDITDLLLYVTAHPTLSGIQRVQGELARNLLRLPDRDPPRFVVVKRRGIATIEPAELLAILDHFRSVSSAAGSLRDEVCALFDRARPCAPRSGDLFLTAGAFWAVPGMGGAVQALKNARVAIGVFVHDLLPISSPEYFEELPIRVFVKAVVEVLDIADFVITSSQYNKAVLTAYYAARGARAVPIAVTPLALEVAKPASAGVEIRKTVARIAKTRFVLCVGTIEVRKNPAYLLDVWKMLERSERADIPTLVFAGRTAWLVQDFIEQLEACGHLGGRIVLLHDLTDQELELLYRRCLLTMFPSFEEGWGLPVGESLAHGKVCIASNAGGIPEVGGDLVDYLDPYDARTGLRQLRRYLDDPQLRREREAAIARNFRLRSWHEFAADLLATADGLMQDRPPYEGLAAVALPPNRFLVIDDGSAARPGEAANGSLSAELACVAGWGVTEADGIPALEPEAVLRFRPAAPAGSRLLLILRLAATGRDGCRVRVRSGSGGQTLLTLKRGVDGVASLSCNLEPDGLVTARLSRVDDENDAPAGPPGWMLKGFLYLQPGMSADGISRPSGGEPPPRRIRAVSAPVQDSRRAASLVDFRRSRNCHWMAGSDTPCGRELPLFADPADRELFLSRYRNHAVAPLDDVAERITIHRRDDQYVSMTRFSEGSTFDATGITSAQGFVEGAPPETPWLAREAGELWFRGEALEAAPYYDRSCLVFFNGNLHNYYHWVAEGALCLDILMRAAGPNPEVSVALPKTMEIHQLIDHRGILKALGFDHLPTFEVASGLIRVREALWVAGDDLIEQVPTTALRSFRRRIATKYADRRGPRRRRLLIERKGPTRVFHDKDAVRAFFATRGFELVSLEGMAPEQQILLFQEAEFIAGAHGAALTNLMFCEPGTKVIEFMPAVEMRPFFWLMSQRLGLVHAMLFCAGVEEQSFQASLRIDFARLQKLYDLVEAQA